MDECEENSNSNFFCFQYNKFVKLKYPEKLKEERRPCARSGHRAVADNNHVWLIGGYNNSELEQQAHENNSCPLFRECWKLNLSTNKWNLMKTDENMPHELASHSAVRHNNYLLVFGGTGVPFGERSSDQLSSCHLPSEKWSVVESTGAKPEKIYGQAMAVIGSNLYIYGGTSGYVYNTELHKMDLTRFVWEKVKPRNHQDELPPVRYRHEIAYDENHIYVLGGGTSQMVYPMDKVYVYSIQQNKWTLRETKADKTTKSFPGSRRCHSCVQLDNKAYICGGYDGISILGDLWQFDLADMQWTKLTDMPEPVYFHSAAVTTEGCMVIFGGVSCAETSKRIDSSYQVWLKIPSLQTMCWLNLVKTWPKLLELSHHELLQMGISQHFINNLPYAEGA